MPIQSSKTDFVNIVTKFFDNFIYDVLITYTLFYTIFVYYKNFALNYNKYNHLIARIFFISDIIQHFYIQKLSSCHFFNISSKLPLYLISKLLGPSIHSPSISNFEPWQGHSQIFSVLLKTTPHFK